MTSWISRAANAGFGGLIIAQVINLSVIAIPILLGRLEQLSPLVMAGAIAGVLAHVLSLGFFGLYPGIASRADRIVLGIFAVRAICAAGVLLSLFSLVTLVAGVHKFFPFLTGLLLVTQGAYLLSTTVLIAQGSTRKFAAVRVAYAVSNLLFTIIAVLIPSWNEGLVAAAAASFAIGAFVASRGDTRRWSRILRRRSSSRIPLQRFWRSGLASFVGGLASQGPAFFLPLLGAYSSHWAVGVRISSGFATVAQYVVGPLFDVRYGAAVRASDRGNMRRIANYALLVGSGLGVLSGLSFLVAGTWAGLFAGQYGVIATVAVVSFCVSSIVPAVATKFVIMRGSQTGQLIWSTCKLATIALALGLFESVNLLVAFALIEMLYAISYALLLRMTSPRGPMDPKLPRL